MEKKKILKILLLLLAIIVVAFTITTARKVIILTSLKNKVAEYKQRSDLHMKTETEEATIETFIKEDIYKTVLHHKEENMTVTQITDYKEKEGRTYWASENEKNLQIRKEKEYEFLKVTPIYTFADSTSFFETIVNAINSRIYTETIDGKECYVIEGMKNTNFISTGDTVNIKGYVDKDTGLRMRMVETVKEDGKKRDKISTYEYGFDKITEEDLQEPNRSEYKIIEN